MTGESAGGCLRQRSENFSPDWTLIRREYLSMTEGGNYTTHEESVGISRRLDLLESDLNRYR